jgi:RluA family pseudouridine synthase
VKRSPTVKKVKRIITGQHAEQHLDELLVVWLPDVLGRPVSKAKVRKLIMAGAVRVNGRPVRIVSKALPSGALIEAYVDVAKLFADATSRDKAFELTRDRILFEDEDLILVDKPHGLPTHATLDADRDNLFAAVARFLSKRDGIVEPYLGIHQRLDRDTSGVVLFTKSQRANPGLADSFAKHEVVKVYQALTGSRSTRQRQQEFTIKNYLGKISSKSKRPKYGAVNADGTYAETSFRVIGEFRSGLWIEAMPKTGRTHQIRVHLAECGLPILGDELYGSDKVSAPRLMLHALRLVFPHPITKQEIAVDSPLPPEFKEYLNGGR